MREQLQKPVEPAPPMPPVPVVAEKAEDVSKPRAKPIPPQPPGSVERFAGPLGVSLSPGPPPIPSLVPPAVSSPPVEATETSSHQVMEASEESMRWMDLKKEIGTIVGALERQVEADSSSSEDLAKAEEEEARDKDFELISGTLNGAMIRIEELEEKLKKMSK